MFPAQLLKRWACICPACGCGGAFPAVEPVRVRLRGLHFIRRNERDIPRQSLLYADILASLARGLALTNNILGADCSARYLLGALSLGEPRRVLEALTMEANFVATVFVKSPYVQRILDVVEEQKDLCRDFSADVYVHAAHGYVDYMNGEWARARENARTAFGSGAPGQARSGNARSCACK
jgi:hypothetical protein